MVLDPDPIGYSTVSKLTRITYMPALMFSFEIEVVGPTCEWCWVIHGPCTPVFGLKGGVWVGAVSVIPIFPADVGYVRQSLQERDHGVEDGVGQWSRASWQMPTPFLECSGSYIGV